MENFWETRLIYKTYVGSHSYGTNTKDSDVDTRGICIPPESYLLGLDNFEQKEVSGSDEVIYSLKKFVHLALNNNPNILDSLFVAPNHIIYSNEFGKELRDLRYDFLSKKVYKTYGGYAYSQLKRMTTVEKNAIGKRKESIEWLGYDGKNALHLIRLLRMGIEILTDGEVNVLRHDNSYLLEIRNGKYDKEYIEEEAKRLNGLLDQAYVTSKLPSKPEYNKINSWLISVHKRSLEWQSNT